MNEPSILNPTSLKATRRGVDSGERSVLKPNAPVSDVNRRGSLPLREAVARRIGALGLPKLACSLVGLLVWLSALPALAQTTSIDLSVRQGISNQKPIIGDVISYTVAVSNAAGSATATNVRVQNSLPTGGVAYVSGSASVLRGTGTYAPGTGVFSINTIAPGDSAVLVIQATVLGQGVYFNTTEVIGADQADVDSPANNQILTEDDYAAVCFSVPILFYQGDEYTVTIPSGYDQIIWYRNDVPISTSTVSTSLAQVNADLSLTFKSTGVYRFVTLRGGCPATNCCDIEVIQGPFGSLGDFVFLDANRNGLQDDGPTGIDGVRVYLYDQTGTTRLDSTVTAGGGRYLFDSLTDGQYRVQFVAPNTNLSFTQPDVTSPADSLDSDAGTNGFTPIYTIDTSRPAADLARNNPNVDAGFIQQLASLGDRVFVDANRDGQQGPPAQEPGLAGVVVSLINTTNGSLVATDTTDAGGLYSFTGLTPGVPYSVSFATPTGYQLTTADFGNDATDSDALAGGATAPITLTASEANTSVDAGFFVPGASLGDRVFVDANRDGQQGPPAQEPGLPGVIVSLINTTNGTLVASDTTDANGNYMFMGLTPGVPYSLSFTVPVGYSATVANVGDDATDSDLLASGVTGPITLTAGENNTSVDAGFFVPSATLGGNVFVDANRDGQQGPLAQEPGLPGVIVSLINTTNGTLVASVTTDANGLYSFTGLTPGTPYSVSFTSPAGYSATVANIGNDASDSDPVGGITAPVTLTAGETNTSVDAGFFVPSATLGDRVFVDANRDGQQGPIGQEPGLQGVVVSLINTTNGSLVATDTTDASGLYSFTGLTPGTPYSLSFTAPTGYSATVANQGNDATDSDLLSTGVTGPITLTAGENNTAADAGFFVPSASLGDRVFVDANRDGQQGPPAQEPGLPGVIVSLINTTNGTLVASDTTDTNGIYMFTGLTPGTPYSVSFTSPAGYSATVANVGNDASDSDPVGGITAPVTLTAGENNMMIDAGFFVPSATLGGNVFVDANRDGQQGPIGQEPGLPGVIVTLINTTNGSIVASVTTDANGVYSFTGLTPGVPYSVSFTSPAGYSATVANVGDDASDSDPVGGVTAPFTLTAGENNTSVDAGFFVPSATLGDRVFVDANRDGQQGSPTQEPGLPGVVVSLINTTNGTLVASVTTDANGLYSFTGLTPGTPYSLSFTVPTGYSATVANVGDDATDSDLLGTGVTGPITLTAGENNTAADAGFFLIPASLGDLVFLDNNANGIQEPGLGETGVAGIRVTLYQNTTATAVASTTTNASGLYSFTGLTPGSGYFVVFDTTGLSALGFTLTPADQGGNDATDSDAGANGQTTQTYSLSSGENNTTVDAGIRPSRFDLALRKTTASTVALAGQQVTYTITVFNQGNVNAFNVAVTDYIPAGMSLAAGSTWTSSGTAVTTTVASLSAGASIDLPLVLTVNAVPAGTTLVNAAEVSSADNDSDPTNASLADIDSRLDNDPTNNGTPEDDVISEDGNAGNDIDNSDIAVIVVTQTPIFDLALTKRLSPTQVQPILPGSQVTYQVQVFNQGTVAAQRIQITDYVPAGLVLADANWTLTNGVATRTLAGTLAAGQDTTVSLVMTVSPNFTGDSLTNAAEISVADDDNDATNGSPIDIDSDFDGNPANDGTAKDDVVTENRKLDPTADEDDSDVAPTRIAQPASLGDLVFLDNNANGIQDGGAETGIASVTVTLYQNSTAVGGTPILVASTTTNASGLYSFTGLTPGVPYSLSFTAPATYSVTVANVGDDTTDSDLLAGGVTAPVTLTSGENNTSVDAGFFAPGSSFSLIVAITPAVCDPTTNGYVATGTATLANAPAGILTITDNGVVTATIAVTAGQTSASFSLTGVSGTAPLTHTVTAGLATLTASATYAVPTTCTVCAAIALTPATLANGQANTPYSQTLTASGGTGPYTFAVINGQLPVGLSLNVTTGVISGTPTAATAVSFTVAVTDSRSCSATAAYTVTPIPAFLLLIVADPTVCNPVSNVYSTTGVVTLVSAPAGTLTITDNGVVAVTVSVTAGQTSVPFNLSGISGTSPTEHTLVASLSSLTATATYDVPLSCTVCAQIALTPTTLIDGLVGAAYSQTLTASGGTAPYSYVVVGSLPVGLSFNTTTGVLSGTPTSATVVSFSVLVSDSRSCTTTAAYSLTVGLTPDIAVAVSEAVCNTATNGYVATGTVSLVGAPAGTLTITDNGVVTAALAVTAGQTSASFSVTGISGSTPAAHTVVASLATLTASTTYATPASCTVCAQIAVGPTELINGLVGAAYSQTITASGGTAPYSYVVVGSLPAGLSFNGTTGVLSGTPTSATVVSFSVLVSDSRSCTTTAAYSLTVGLTPDIALTIVDPAVCDPTTNGYVATAVVSLVGAPAGTLTITDNGVVTGTIAVTAGQTSASFSVTGVSGSAPATHTLTASLATLTASTTYATPASCTVCPTIAVGPATLIDGLVGASYSQTLTASGGVAPYTYAVVGSLPTGLSFDVTTGVLSGTPTSATTISFAVVVTDSRSCTGTASYSLAVGLTPDIAVVVSEAVCNSITNGYSATGTVSLVGAPTGTLTITDNGVVTATIAVTAGQTSASFSLTGVSGSLPATHTVVATLATLTASTTYATPASCTVCALIAVTPTNLIDGLVGAAYSQTLTASSGTAPYSYVIVGSLPTGLSFNGSTGVISGTPTSTTVASFTVLVTDSRSCTATAAYSLTVGLTPDIAVVVGEAVCDPTTNGYVATGTVSLVGAPAGTLTITDNGVVTATIAVTAGQTSASFSLTGVSGSLPVTHTVVATLATLTANTTYATPASCTTCPTITLAPALANGQANSPYSQTLTASGGTGPYTFAVVNGGLPLGLSLDVTTGVISGTPTAATAVSFTVAVTDSRSCSATAAYTINPIPAFLLLIVADPTVCNPVSNVYSTTGVVTLVSAPAGTLTITDNGVVAVTVSVTAGQTSVPFNLSGLSGTSPTEHTLVASLSSLTATATYDVPLSCTVCAQIALTPSSLIDGLVGAAYSQTLTASGGTAPYSYVVVGSLPAGLSFNGTTGVLSGTPTSATVVSFSVLVSDSRSCTTTAAYSLTVGLTPDIALTIVDPAVCDPTTNGYVATAVVSLVGAPAGTLTITDNGVVTATIAVTAGQTSASFSVTGVSGSAPATHTLTASLATLTASTTYATPASCTVCPTIAVGPATLIDGLVGAAYSQTLTASGGVAPYTYAVVGSLPTGLSFDVTTGVLSGTPTSATTTSFAVVVTDSRSCTGTASYSLTVGLTPDIAISVTDPAVCDPLTNVYSATAVVSMVGAPAGTLTITDNGVVTATLTVTAGQTSAIFNLTGISGSLPPTHTIVATLASLSASTTYATPASCTVCPTIAVGPATLIDGLVGASYSQTLTASGGTGPYTYVVSGSLPTGLSFNGSTGVLSGTPTSTTVVSFSVLVSDSRSCTTTAAYSLTVGLTPDIAISVVDPVVCDPITNIYSTTGVVSLVGAPAGTLTITDNGVVIATVSVTAGQTSVNFSATGVSGSLPPTHTVVATLSTLTASTSYATPASCTVCPTIALAPVSIGTGQVGAAYSQTLTASGGVAPYTYAVVGSLPIGLSLDVTTGVLSGTPTSAGTTVFTVLVSDSRSCTTTATYSLTVQLTCPTDFSLVTSADAIICNGETISLTATTGVSGVGIRWFLTATDGTAFAATNAGESLTVNPTMTTVYYAEAFTTDGCVSIRRPITVTVTTVPTPTFAGNLRNTCPATTADLTTVQITNQTGGLTYEWYTSLERSAATRVTNLTAVGAGQYYLFARSGSCYGSPAVLTVEIINCNCQTVAGVSVGSSLTTCSGQPVPLQAVLSGAATSLSWSSNGTGVFSSPTSLTTAYTPSAADSIAGRVVLTATTNDPDGVGGVCSTGTSSLVLTINPRPVPMGVACDDTLICLGSSTKLIGLMPGIRYNWYDSDGRLIGTTQGGGKLTVTPSRAGAVVYYGEAVSAEGCVSATRAAITITVGTCQADLAVVKQIVTPAPYQVGQKITYSITVSNNGPIAATDVNVSDLLPANLTYVSSTPTGQYAAGTGNWTVGTLTAGSNRNLLMEATINAGGSITNTAVVTGTNNDLNKTSDDTSSVTIPVNGCTVQAPFITCALTTICAGGETTLTATGCTGGTVRWSNGQTGATITVRPTLTTTYSASCVAANCVSGASNAITVTVNNPQTPTLTANVDRVCPGGDVVLTAAGCEGGTYQWVGRTETTASITVNPTSRTTYTVQCRMGNCVSAAATKTIDMNTTLPTPTIVCSTSAACPGEEVTLTVVGCTGTPVWSTTTATTSSIIVRPTVGNNSYSVRCQSGSCSSLESPAYVINLVTPTSPTVTASADTVCANGSVTLTATGCNGSVKWSNGLIGTTVTVKPDASISYSAQCQFRTCLSEPSNAVAITVLTPSAPLISASSGTVCSGESVTLTAQGCEGTVRWNIGGVTGASITLRPAATQTYFATCLIGACEGVQSNEVAVVVGTSGTAPSITASTLNVCSGGVVSLTATGCAGTVLWSDGQTGAVVSVTATPTNREFYAVCQVGAACGSGRSNVVAVTVTPMPTPTVVCSTDTICPGEEITLLVENCQGTPTWSNGQTTTSIVVKPSVTTTYSVFCRNGACTSATSVGYTLTVVPVTAPTITASATAVAPGETVTLTATGCNGTVIWSENGIDGRNTGASIIVRPEGTETYSAQCQFRSCLSDPSTTIVVNPGNCVADAGTMVPTTATVCAGTSSSVVIAARSNGGLVQPAGYTVAYVLTKGSGLVIQQMGTTPQFTVAADAADYTVHTLVYDAQPTSTNYVNLSGIVFGTTTAADVIRLIADRKVCADLDMDGAKVTVRRMTSPVLTVDQQVVCAGTTVTITAHGCEGGIVNWKDGSVGQSITRTIYSDLWMMATCTIDGCTSELSPSIDMTVRTPGIPTVASNRAFVCANESATLTAMGCEGGTYIWSNGSTGSTLTVSPTVDTQYRVRCKVGSCEGDWSPYTTVEVGAPAAPTISVAGQTGNATVCFGAPITLTAEGCPANSYVVWSNDQVGSSITLSLANGNTYTARCCTSNNCKSDPSNAITLTVLTKIPAPITTDRTNTCPFNTVDLTTAVGKPATTGGVYEYYTSTTLTEVNRVANPNAVGTGTYYVVERTVNGCTGLPGVIHVQINACTEQVPCNTVNPVTVSAGADASICAAKTYRLNGTMSGAASAYWTTTGTGTFDNPFSPTATYTASVGDVLAGRVTLKLTATASNTACGSAQDELVLTIDGAKTVPVVRIVGATQLCFGDSVRLEAPAGAGYLWSNRATTQSIMVRQGGSYSVQILDQNGCSSVKSENVIVRVAEPVEIPLASNLRNDCPAAIVNLTRALSATTAGSTYEYRIGELASSSMLMRPDSVGAGTYYVFARNAAGCVSSPARVTVSIFNCAADSLTSDLSITKTANKQAVRQGETVLYTIKVRNNGNHTARNIDVRDVLPAGLEPVVGPTSGYTVSNGVISRRIDSLLVGRTDSIVVAAIVRAKGAIVNTATITYADQRDPNPANNSASATVEDNTPYRSSQIGLAKAVVGQPTSAGDSIRATYRFTLTNFGDDTLRNVRLTDDLAYAFRPNTIRSATFAGTNPGSTLAFNPAFTGAGGNVNLLDSASYLAPGRTQTFFLNVTVGRLPGDTTRTFHNIANVTAGNRTTTVSDQSADGGDTDPDGDGNPTNNAGLTTFTLGTQSTSGPSIGVALAVVKSEAMPDSSYNVMYQAIVKNFGDVPLMNVHLTDSLMRAFAAPASYSVVSAPVVSAGSGLVVNAGYNGNTDVNLLSETSKLAVGQQDTVRVMVNIRPNGNNGPFFTNAIATGMTTDSSQVVRDISNNGYDPKPEGAVSTPVRFNLPSALLGVAKSVGQPTRVEDGVYDIPYTIKLTNMGSVALKKVQVVDNLSQTFGRGALIVSNRIRVAADSGFVADSTFTGQGLITNLLVDSLSTLPTNGSRSLSFTVRVNVKNADTLTFLNSATATALSTDGTVVSDQSAAGTNVDPDNDLDPRNNSTPTPVRLDSLTGTSHIGIAMAVRDTVRQANGSFNVTYQIVVKNYGKEVLTGVSISDTLSKVFNATTGASFTVIQAPVTTSTGSALKLNSQFNGDQDPRIVLGDSSSSLAVGKVDTIMVKLNVMSTGTTTTFLNWATAEANAKSREVADVSTNGLQPDLNGNGNPTDANEREGTPLMLPLTNTALFIPQGFSPNGDGVNDRFVIRGLNGLTVGLEVFNRWGHCVYRTNNYQNDWDGTPNTGIVIGSESQGVPDGTYYYVIQTSDGRKFVRYMTINR